MKHKDDFQILPLNMKHNPLCTFKNCIKNASSKLPILQNKFSQNMKRKDVFQILPLNMKHNPFCTFKNCIKNAS